MPSDIEIAQAAKMQRIAAVAREKLGIAEEHLEPYGHYKAKVSLKYLDTLKGKKNGKLILVTAMTPTPPGEGKTTTTVGLGDALNHIGKKAVICLREPSLGPVFGVKGGAAGGGYAQVVPMEDINLHFTGDFGAIQLANNLLAAMLDNHIHHGNELGIDVRRIQWKRVLDMNDRALRETVVSLGGPGNGYPRQDGFDIVVASEVMAIFCLSTSLEDLKKRLGNIVVGYSREQKPSHRARSERPRRDDGAAEGRARAEPGADAREQPRVHPRRPVRQHRARLQLGDRDAERAQARRLRGDRGGLRRRPRRREVPRHQVPQVRPAAERRRHRGDDPRAQVPRRRRREGSEQGEPRRAGQGPGQPRAPRRERIEGVRDPVRGVDQPLHRRYQS